MARDLSGRIIIAGVLAAAVALGVTAAVTSAHPQPAGNFAPVITNLNTGKTATFRTRYPSQQTCDAAIGHLPAFVRWVADPASNAENQPAEDPNTDPRIKDSVERLVVQLWMNTGVLPNLSFACELQGDPA